METYATDHNGNYEGATAKVLNEYEKTIKLCGGSTAKALNEACLKETTVSGTGYTVTAESTGETGGTAHTFSVTHSESGNVRSCTPTGKTGSEGGGCQNSSW